MPFTHQLRALAKLVISATLYYSGLLGFLLRRRYANQGLVLLYHRVLPATESSRSNSSDAIIVTPVTFSRHLRVLRKHFTFVSPREFEEWHQGKRQFPKPPCLISFDDGWKDNGVYAEPLLREQQVPALIFLPTDYIGTGKLFWQERFSALLDILGQSTRLSSHPLVRQHGLENVFQDNAAVRSQTARDVARRFKACAPDKIDSVVADVSQLVQTEIGQTVTSNVDSYLDWSDVQSMQSRGIHFGSHAVSHRILTRLDDSAIRDELSSSRMALEQKLNRPVRMLAFPNGDHNASTCRLAQETGYTLAFTTKPGWVKPGDDPYRLKRINIHERAHRHTPVLYASILGIF